VTQSVFFFGNGKAEATKDDRDLLGGKGANLAEMTNLGVPVPPGFTMACNLCDAYLAKGTIPAGLVDEGERARCGRVCEHVRTEPHVGDEEPAGPQVVSHVREGGAQVVDGLRGGIGGVRFQEIDELNVGFFHVISSRQL